jgi:hypothetical protein
MLEDRRRMGAFAPVPHVRPRRVLRSITRPAATQHFRSTHHPVIEGYDPPEGWAWCYVDELFFDLGKDVTPQDGPIPRFV